MSDKKYQARGVSAGKEEVQAVIKNIDKGLIINWNNSNKNKQIYTNTNHLNLTKNKIVKNHFIN